MIMVKVTMMMMITTLKMPAIKESARVTTWWTPKSNETMTPHLDGLSIHGLVHIARLSGSTTWHVLGQGHETYMDIDQQSSPLSSLSSLSSHDCYHCCNLGNALTNDMDGQLESGSGIDGAEDASGSSHVCPHVLHVCRWLDGDATTSITCNGY